MFLHICFTLCALLSTLGIYMGVEGLSHWWSLPILAGIYLASIVIYLLGLYVVSFFLPKKEPVEKPKRFCRFFIVTTMRYLVPAIGVRTTVKGREKLPAEPCVIISNHLSAYDPMVALAAFPERNLAYISKEENMKLPIVGSFIWHAGFHAIDRENGMRALRTLKHAAGMIKSCGLDMGIYPEGTRSRTGELLEFKTGAFLLAKRADAPLVIMVTRGSERVTKNALRRKTRVELEILQVLSREEVKGLSIEELTDKCREIIKKGL